MKNALVVPLVFLLLASASSAWAQIVRDPAAAEELFQHGKTLLLSGDWEAACAKFRGSMALDPAVGTLLKIARCDEHDRRLALALHDYQQALELNRTKADQTEARRAELDAFARAALAELEPRVPRFRVAIETPPPGLRVTRGGEELPPGAFGEALPVDPGAIEVVATAPGYRTQRTTVQVLEGVQTGVSLSLVPLESDAPADRTSAPAPPSVDASRTGSWRARRIGAYALGGAGLVTLGVAGVFGIETLAKVNQASPYCVHQVCKQTGYNLIGEASQMQDASFILLAAGASLVGAGVVLYLTTPGKGSESLSVGLTVPSCVLRGTF
jgi:hypothetical protein